MTLDLTSPHEVFAGTLFGETRGCGRAAMENVAQVILNRAADKWDAGGVVGVCLAPLQFSCWNASDPNRAKILAAPGNRAEAAMWALCLDVAGLALEERNPDRVSGADCYYARSIPAPPYWARPPARLLFADGSHVFWRTRLAPHAPALSVHAVARSPLAAARVGPAQQSGADALMEAEQAALDAKSGA